MVIIHSFSYGGKYAAALHGKNCTAKLYSVCSAACCGRCSMKCNTMILHLLKELLSECMQKIKEDKNSYVSNPAYFTRK